MLIFLLAIGGFILYFNGQHVKAPLLDLINEHARVEFNAENVEFSPLYPNVLKLHDVSVDTGGHIDELYLEYDLKSLLSGHILIINELFAQGLTLPERTLEHLRSETLGFAGINFKKIRLADASLTVSPQLQAQGLSLNLQDVDFKPGRPLEIQSGTLALREGRLDNLPVKNLSCEFKYLEDELYMSQLQADTLSGSISGDLSISPKNKTLNFEKLVLTNNVIKCAEPLLTDYQIVSPQSQLYNLVLVFDNDLLLSGISGKLSDFKRLNTEFSGDLQGSIEEISLPQEELTFEDNQVKFSHYGNLSSLRLAGKVLEGSVNCNLDYDARAHQVKIHELHLQGQKLEVSDENLKRLNSKLDGLELNLISAELNNLEFLSKLKELPLSIKAISGSLKGFNYQSTENLTGAPVGVADLELTGLLYQDLGMRRVKLLANISKDLYSLTLPEVTLNQGSFSLNSSYSFLTHNFYLFAKSPNFELRDLNCSMIPHLLDGKVQFEIGLRGTEDLKQLPRGLKGQLNLSGQNILISRFGLDLINGGPTQNYELSGQDLLEAMSLGDCGISSLKFKSDWNGEQADFSSSFTLPVSQVSVTGRVSLSDLDLSGKAYFISSQKDAVTVVSADGALTNPHFRLNAFTRSEVRPGLYFSEEQTRTIIAAEQQAKAAQQELYTRLEQIREQALNIQRQQSEVLKMILPYGEKSIFPKPSELKPQQALPLKQTQSEIDRLEQNIFKNLPQSKTKHSKPSR